MGVFELVLRYDAEVWAAERENPGPLLRRAGEGVIEAGALIWLYWPARDPLALVVVEGSRAVESAGESIAVRAGGRLESLNEVELTTAIASVGADRAAEIAMAMPAPKWRCLRCGMTKPPHLEGCPYRIEGDAVRLVASTSASSD